MTRWSQFNRMALNKHLSLHIERAHVLFPFQAEILRKDSTPSVREMLEKVSASYVDFDEFAELPGAGDFFINVNTPDDLTGARQMYRPE